MSDNKKTYTNDSISSLKGADRVRLKPSVIFGSDDIEGCCHSVFEIISNSIDEARDGFGDTIIVTKYKDLSISVEDFGRGIPVDFNQKEGVYNYKLLFEEMYAGGKYKFDNSDNYEFSLGLNGLGLCSTQYTSEYMSVIVHRDKYEYKLNFEKGYSIGELEKIEEPKQKKTGTYIKWRPDLEVFTEIDIPVDFLSDIMNKQAIVNKGIKFVLNIETDEGFNTEEFFYENGIVDYMNEISEDIMCPIQHIQCERIGRDREDRNDYKVKMEIAYTFSNKTQKAEYYHNSSFLEYGGSPDKAVRSAFLSEIDNYIKRTNKYNKNETKINIQDILDCLIIVTNTFSTQTSYENQTKKAINNKFIQEAMTAFIKEQLEIFFLENTLDAEKVVNQILVNKRSRESAEKSRVAIKKKLSGAIDIQNRVEKFVDCRSRDVSERELFIVEGDSALGSCKLGRNAEFQAIMPIRGKILNCLKADLNRIFKSDIIMDLVKVLGCGIEVKVKGNKDNSFDIKNLRWDKIIICTDGDVDGFQIRTLVLTMIYRLMPSLINEGKVYIVESPLYEIKTKNKTYFAFSEGEKNKIISKINGSYDLSRSKGLGENNPDMMWETTMNPETRRLIQINPDDLQEMEIMFDLLLGDNLQGRKAYIEENGHLYLDNLDLE